MAFYPVQFRSDATCGKCKQLVNDPHMHSEHCKPVCRACAETMQQIAKKCLICHQPFQNQPQLAMEVKKMSKNAPRICVTLFFGLIISCILFYSYKNIASV